MSLTYTTYNPLKLGGSFVYLLNCLVKDTNGRTHRFYTGETSDFFRRLLQHVSGECYTTSNYENIDVCCVLEVPEAFRKKYELKVMYKWRRFGYYAWNCYNQQQFEQLVSEFDTANRVRGCLWRFHPYVREVLSEVYREVCLKHEIKILYT